MRNQRICFEPRIQFYTAYTDPDCSQNSRFSLKTTCGCVAVWDFWEMTVQPTAHCILEWAWLHLIFEPLIFSQAFEGRNWSSTLAWPLSSSSLQMWMNSANPGAQSTMNATCSHSQPITKTLNTHGLSCHLVVGWSRVAMGHCTAGSWTIQLRSLWMWFLTLFQPSRIQNCATTTVFGHNLYNMMLQGVNCMLLILPLLTAY